MKSPAPVLVTHLFPEVLDHLIALLKGLSPEDWQQPTVCPGWSVKDVAQHLLGVELGNLSRRRDGYSLGASIDGWDELVTFVNRKNQSWVEASRVISAPILIDLLQHTGTQMNAYFQSLNPFAIGSPVSWAGPQPAPVWLDLAREYTERWHHQQHIRDAVNRPGLKEPRYLAPVLATLIRALPRAYASIQAPAGTCVAVAIIGLSGSDWSLVRGAGWELFEGANPSAAAWVALPEDVAWRLFTRGLTPEAARPSLTWGGDPGLALKLLEAVSIIA